MSPAGATTASVGLDIEEEPVGQAVPLALERWPERTGIPDMLGETRAGEVDRDAVELGPGPHEHVDAMKPVGWLSPPVAQDQRIGDEGPSEVGRKNEGEGSP